MLGLIVLGVNIEIATGATKYCPQFCNEGTEYMLCRSSGDKKRGPACNCCVAPPGCTIYLSDGRPWCSTG